MRTDAGIRAGAARPVWALVSVQHDDGFGITRADGSAMTPPEMEEAIRIFLAEIDPAIGYLKE